MTAQEVPPRPEWDRYFIDIAHKVSTRATCPRARVGAVFTYDNRILTTGYNGAPSGTKHCSSDGCVMLDGHCVRVIHAEANGIVQAARAGINLSGSTVYCSLSPCVHCANLMIGVGVLRVVYAAAYLISQYVREAFKAAGVTLELISEE